MDIGGTNTVYGLVDAEGNCLKSASLPTGTNYEKQIKAVSEGIKELLGQIEDAALLGIGVGAPNANYYSGFIKSPPNLTWGDFNLVAEIKKHFDLPVFLTNDANAAAIGEKVYGAGREIDNFIVITLGTGLGSGLIVNGGLLHGAHGFAGEIGHIIAVENGRQCGCGRQGCLETYVSARGICRTALELLVERNGESLVSGVKPSELTSEKLYEFALAGDSLSLLAFEKTGEILGRKMADVVAIAEPEKIFLFGGLANAGKLILEPANRALQENLLPVYRGTVDFQLSGLQGKNIAILGAAALARKSGM